MNTMLDFVKTNRKNNSLRSKRFQSSYCAKVRAEAKKKVEGGGGGKKRRRRRREGGSFFPLPLPCHSFSFFFLLLSQLSRRTSPGNACYAG